MFEATTVKYTLPQEGANLVILENNRMRVFHLDQDCDSWSLGRFDPSSADTPDILFRSAIVSRKHGALHKKDGHWYYWDNPGNLNGTFHNGKKIRRDNGTSAPVLLEHGDVLRIDNDDLDHVNPQGVLLLYTTAPVKGTWTVFPLTAPHTMIGRDKNCDLVESLPYISAQHARISQENGHYYLSDCGSHAGTYLNGHPVCQSTLLRERDCISLCDCNYFFLGDRLLYAKRDYTKEQIDIRLLPPELRPVILSANIQEKAIYSRLTHRKEKVLLENVQLNIREGNLVAVLGTAGAGKSTLMGCISGQDQSGVTGSIIYRGVDLIKNLKQIKYLIGNVPQEKLIYPELTPKETFLDAAEKRLSAETTTAQIDERVQQTLELLSLTNVKDSRNPQLSGGEKTRVNLGIDMVADRDIYFLDEPEQGLSPNLRWDLYVFLQNLTRNHGKTIVAIIHDVSCIDMFDQVIFIVKANNVGRLAFSGSPEECKKQFGETSFAKIYAQLESTPEKFVR